MDLKLHNGLELPHEKALKAVSFFANSTLGKFKAKQKWKVEVWTEDQTVPGDKAVSCGITLERPNKTTLYTKRYAENFQSALKKSFSTLERIIRKEGKRWSYENLFSEVS